MNSIVFTCTQVPTWILSEACEKKGPETMAALALQLREKLVDIITGQRGETSLQLLCPQLSDPLHSSYPPPLAPFLHMFLQAGMCTPQDLDCVWHARFACLPLHTRVCVCVDV